MSRRWCESRANSSTIIGEQHFSGCERDGKLVIVQGCNGNKRRLTLSLLPMFACSLDLSPVIQGRSCPMNDAGSSQSRLGGTRSRSIKSRQRKQKI
jgi:hypothetical protein